MSAPHIPGLTDLRPLGHGGFATVYRAHQARLGREVAVKVGDRLLGNERDRRRFLREAHAAGRLSSHPHVVTVHDSGFTSDGRPYLVMELCEGSLSDHLRAKGRFPADRVREIGVQLADALATAHELGILHRDIKPANVLVDAFGTVKLADFGLAAILDAHSESTVTRDALSPNYAAPEAFAMVTPTVAADIYALAATLYTLLAGSPPREIPWPVDSLDHLAAVLKTPVAPVSGASPELMATLTEALDPEASQRTSSAARLRDQLQGHVEQPKRKPWLAVTAAAAVVTLLLLGLGWFFLGKEEGTPTTTSSSPGLIDCGDENGLCIADPSCYQTVSTTPEGKRTAERAASCNDEHLWEAFSGDWLPADAKAMTLKQIQGLPGPKAFCTEKVMRQRARKPLSWKTWAVLPVVDEGRPYFHCIAGPGKNGKSSGSVFTGERTDDAPPFLQKCDDGFCMSEPTCYRGINEKGGEAATTRRTGDCAEEHFWEAFGGGWLSGDIPKVGSDELVKAAEVKSACTKQKMKAATRPKVDTSKWEIVAVGFRDGDRNYFHCLAAPEKGGQHTTSAFNP